MSNVILQVFRSREQEALIEELTSLIKSLKPYGTETLHLKAPTFNLLYDLIAYPKPEHKKEFFWQDILIKRVG